MQTSEHTQQPATPINATVDELAAAFTEWDRRYREEPERFMSEAEHLLKETPETYGEGCAPYFVEILNDLRKSRDPYWVRKAPTIFLIGPQGCGKSTHAQAFARAFGCTHVIDGESLNGFDVDDPAAIPREGALIIGPERAEDCLHADLVIEARTKAGFDKAVALLPSGA